MFSRNTIVEIEKVALENKMDAAALLAIAEVESGGKAFATIAGRKEPLIRFEGHYFDRFLDSSKRSKARSAGLSAPKWGIVKNPRKQSDRWRLLQKAMRLDHDAAIQSVSWGVGQVMGANWKALGYTSPKALVDEARSSVSGQVRLMVRFIKANGLSHLVASRDWAGFARRYNGPSYKKNRYDTRMAAAYARHSNKQTQQKTEQAKLRTTMLSMLTINDALIVSDMQRLLLAAGFVVKVDGLFGVKTDAALRAFQKQAGLVVDGIYGPKTKRALQYAAPQFGSGKKLWQLFWRIIRTLSWQKMRGKL